MTTQALIERPRWTCALGGALAAAGNLPGLVPILHAGPGCAGNFAWANNGAAGLNVTGECLSLSVPSTNLQESEVVFGGLERLREQIGNTAAIIGGDLYLVLTGCLPEVIGDDVGSLVTEFARRGLPVAAASTPGFKGDSYLGYEEVLKVLIRGWVARPGRRSADKRRPDLVNVWGVPPTLDPFWRGDLAGIGRLLSLLGLEANLIFGPDESLKNLKGAGRAALNVVASGLYGLEAAELFKEIHGVDYVRTPLPIGAAASERFLAAVGRALKIPRRRLAKAVEAAGAGHYRRLEPIIDVYNDMEAQRHALVVGDANYAPALSVFLSEDLGWVPELVVIVNDLGGDEQQALLSFLEASGGLAGGKVVFEHRSERIAALAGEIWPKEPRRYQDPKRPILVAASSLERGLAADLGAAHLSLTWPVSNRAILTRGHTGFDGGLVLTEDVVSACVAGR